MDLPPPSILTLLPRPLQAATGKTQVGEVFSLVESKKRKRYEVAVAVDGEGLNIYNIQYPKLITSYAVPPQSEFSCCPFSIRLKNNESTIVRRYTYCAVGRPQTQIKGFFEETIPGSTSAPVITSASYVLKDSRSPVIFVGIIPRHSDESSSENPFDVLVVHEDGEIRRITSDLETERWNVRLPGLDHGVLAAFLVDFDDARKVLFKRRSDLVTSAVGDLSVSVNATPPVLLLVSRLSNFDAKVHMFSVTTCDETAVSTIKSSHELHHLDILNLPSIDRVELDIKEIQWAFHPGSASLGLSFRHGYANYDISQHPPRCTSSLILGEEDFSSVMRISPHTVIGAGKSRVSLYDTHYSSIRCSMALRELLDNKSSKRVNFESATKFVAHFGKLGIALAITENTLLAFDLSSIQSIRGTSVKRQRDGLLIDAVGRGVGSLSSGANDLSVSLDLKTDQEVDQWNMFKDELKEACKAKNPASFDQAVISYFGYAVEELSLMSVHPEKVSHVLSQIFNVRQVSGDARNSYLEVAIWPEKTCKWLLKLKQLSLNPIDIAVRRASRPQILPPFEPGTLVRALAEFDSSLKVLAFVLAGSSSLEWEELARALKIFLVEARARSMALNNPTSTGTTDGDVNMDGNHHETENRLTVASSSPVATLEHAFTGLNLTLSRLHDYPTSQIVSCIRSTLSNTDTLAIVHHLRVSLATGGYTARFTEQPPIPLGALEAAPPLSLEAIINLMNASVDAIGLSGWVSAVEFAGTAVNEAEMISHIQSEVSAALAGIEEAVYMKGIVGEFIRYGNRLTKSTSSSAAAAAEATKKGTSASITMGAEEDDEQNTAIKNGRRAHVSREYDLYGKLWETYTFSKAGDEDGKMLPLSLRAPESEINPTKVRKSTGEIKQRTKREMAYLQRQAVPEYSVVKINL